MQERHHSQEDEPKFALCFNLHDVLSYPGTVLRDIAVLQWQSRRCLP